MKKEQRIILFINNITSEDINEIKDYSKSISEKIKIGIIKNNKKNIKNQITKRGVNIVLTCNLNKPLKIAETLNPYQDFIIGIIARGEKNIPELEKIAPHLPYINNPTSQSLSWTTDKITMRQRLKIFDKTITPKFAIISDSSEKNIEKIINKVGFPLVLKPSGLAESLLVSICYYREELETNLRKTIRKINRIYKENQRDNKPKILAEQFLDGEMYSIDAYVNNKGKVFFCPLVHVKTGRSIGFDDFFGYKRMTPTSLKSKSITKAQSVAEKAIKALGLKNSSAHIELMRDDENDWKIIELGPRIGGFRDVMYKLSYNINHSLNDVLIKLGNKPKISTKIKGYCAVFQFFARKEDELISLKGINLIKKLDSFYGIKKHKKIGDKCLYAKHGGKSIIDLIMFNKNRSELLADIRKVEKFLIIKTSAKN